MGKVGFKYHNSNSTIYAGIIIFVFIGIDMFTGIVILENFVNFRFSVQLNFIKLISISKPNNIKAYHSHWRIFLTIFLL